MGSEREMADELVMGYIAAGRSEYVDTLIRRHAPALLALLRRAAPETADADDIFQDVWLRVVRSARSFDPQQRFTAWLFGIAWNQVRSRWRAHRRQESMRCGDADEHLGTLTSPGPAADETLFETERRDRLRRLLAQLPEPLAEAVCLRYFEELSEKEMAARLGVPVGTVKSRLYHGMKRLSPLLRGEP